MKIQYKAALWITLVGVIIVLLMSIGYNKLSYNLVLEKELKNIQSIAEQTALHIESHIYEKTRISLTLASAHIIKKGLQESNLEFVALPEEKREQEIDALNKQWMEASSKQDPFVKRHMTTPIAEYLKHQQKIFPGEYGEIFLTNRYGVMIATTGKLTTLSHANKYWWKASYNSGKGKVFLDDRGFDKSVEGYVLGIVVPITLENEVIGILKSNINIMGSLTDVVQRYSSHQTGSLQIARTGGLIVAKKGVTPLSRQISDTLIHLIQNKGRGNTIIEENHISHLVAYAPISVTMGTEDVSFGGKQKSIDQLKGNQGEGWHIIISRFEASAIEIAHKTTELIILAGLVFTLLIALAALLLGRFAAKPIIELAESANQIGKGNLGARTMVRSNDEIGSLADSLNQMAQNLQETMTSRDALVLEVKQRKQAEAEKEKTIIELEKAAKEIKTLSGIVPICSYCKGIRDDNGYWTQLEKFISKHSKAEFSHGICDSCYQKHYSKVLD